MKLTTANYLIEMARKNAPASQDIPSDCQLLHSLIVEACENVRFMLKDVTTLTKPLSNHNWVTDVPKLEALGSTLLNIGRPLREKVRSGPKTLDLIDAYIKTVGGEYALLTDLVCGCVTPDGYSGSKKVKYHLSQLILACKNVTDDKSGRRLRNIYVTDTVGVMLKEASIDDIKAVIDDCLIAEIDLIKDDVLSALNNKAA